MVTLFHDLSTTFGARFRSFRSLHSFTIYMFTKRKSGKSWIHNTKLESQITLSSIIAIGLQLHLWIAKWLSKISFQSLPIIQYSADITIIKHLQSQSKCYTYLLPSLTTSNILAIRVGFWNRLEYYNPIGRLIGCYGNDNNKNTELPEVIIGLLCEIACWSSKVTTFHN